MILLVGERPGWGSQKASPATPFTRREATTAEADRTCISNIHQGRHRRLSRAVIVDLAKRMLEQKASGINMT